MKEVTMLRRENAPHLNFLKKQVEKFEKAKEMQAELAGLYREYLKKESVYLEKEKSNLTKEKNKISVELASVAKKISLTEDENSRGGNRKIEELRAIEKKINEIRALKNEMERKLGRIEGMLESKENKVKLSGRCPLCGNEIKEMHPEQIEKRQQGEKELEELKNSQQEVVAGMKNLEVEEVRGAESAESLKQAIDKEMETLRDLEREKFTWKVKHQELTSQLELINIKEGNLRSRNEAFEREIKEGIALVGEEILSYKNQKNVTHAFHRLHQNNIAQKHRVARSKKRE